VLSKRPADAIRALQHAIRVNPSSGQAYYNLALALRADGQLAVAQDASRRACALERRYCS
jgi:tetratricopeptide (TPR) repeat protein